MRPTPPPVMATCLTAALAALLLGAPALAAPDGVADVGGDPAEPTAAAEAAAEAQTAAPEPSRWAGSRVNLINQVNVWELDRGNSLTWDPYYALGVGLAPRFRLLDELTVGASIQVVRELTESNVTTRDGEWWFDDLSLSFSAAGIELPVIGTRVAGGLAFYFPTSKASQAATLQVGIRPSLAISHRFGVLSGLTLAYNGSLRVNAHEYTTAEQETPLIPTCRGAACAELSHTGVRNTRWQHGHRVGFSLGLVDWLSIGAGAGLYVSHLYDLVPAEGAGAPTVEPAHERFAASTDAELTFGPWRGASIGLGVASFHPQLAPDQSRYAPFYNRYTQAYLDLRIDVAGLLTPEEG